MKTVALIFAGGTGKRMKCDIPKQFLKIHHQEVIAYVIDCFEKHQQIDEIYVVCIKKWIPYLKKIMMEHGFSKVIKIIPGGKTGMDSIFLGLQEIAQSEEDAIVLIHDGVRPLITRKNITDCIRGVKKYGSIVMAIPCLETPIISSDGQWVQEVLDRQNIYVAQAPQGFYLSQIYAAHLQERNLPTAYQGIIDSCGLMHKYGYEVHFILGNRSNIKLTTKEDYYALIGLFEGEKMDEKD